jgi:hypothetical protein
MSDAEQHAIACIGTGAVADFSAGNRRPAIRASVLDALAGEGPPRGIRVRGARIEGPLDLTDCALAALILEDCEIAERLELKAARLGRLSIRASRFAGLQARSATIDGPVDFAGTSALNGEAWVDLGDTRIAGGIDGCDAKLQSPPARPKEQVPPWDHNYALRISDAHIGGSVHLNGRFVALGGFCLDNAHIRGSLWARGANIVAGEGDAFHPGDAIHGHCAEIDGMLALNFDFTAQGRVWMLGAHIGDRVTVGFGAKLRRVGESYDWGNRLMNQTVLLLFDQAEIGGSLHIADFEFTGAISLTNARVGAGASIIEGRIANRTADGRGTAIAMDGARVDGNLTIGKSLSAEGKVSLAHARVSGQLDCRGARLVNATEDGNGVALDAAWAEIGHGVSPAGLEDEGGGEGFRAEGRVSFANAFIAQS